MLGAAVAAPEALGSSVGGRVGGVEVAGAALRVATEELAALRGERAGTEGEAVSTVEPGVVKEVGWTAERSVAAQVEVAAAAALAGLAVGMEAGREVG